MTHHRGTERPVSGGGERRRFAMLLSHTLQDLEREIAGHSRRLYIVGRFHATSGSPASRHAMIELRALRDRAIGDLWAVHDVACHSNEGRIVPPKGLSKQTLIAFARQTAGALPRRAGGGGNSVDSSALKTASDVDDTMLKLAQANLAGRAPLDPQDWDPLADKAQAPEADLRNYDAPPPIAEAGTENGEDTNPKKDAALSPMFWPGLTGLAPSGTVSVGVNPFATQPSTANGAAAPSSSAPSGAEAPVTGQQQSPSLSAEAQEAYNLAFKAAKLKEEKAGDGSLSDPHASARAFALTAVSKTANNPQALSDAIAMMTPEQAASFVGALGYREQGIGAAQARLKILESLNEAGDNEAARVAIGRIFADTRLDDFNLYNPQFKSHLAAGIARARYAGAASDPVDAEIMRADRERLEGLLNSREGQQLLLSGPEEKRTTALLAIWRDPSITAESLNGTGDSPEQSPAVAAAMAEVMTPYMPNREQRDREVKRLQAILSTDKGQEALFVKYSSPFADNKEAVREFVRMNPGITAGTITSGQSPNRWQPGDLYSFPGLIVPMVQERLKQWDGKPWSNKGQAFQHNDLLTYLGSALHRMPALPGNMSGKEAMDKVQNGELSLYAHDADVNRVANTIVALGGANAEVTSLPVTYSSRATGPVHVPLFRVKTEKGEQYVDSQGNPYNSFQDWIDHNKLPSGLMVYPEKGQLPTGESGELKLASGPTPKTDKTLKDQLFTAADYAALAGGVFFGGPPALAAAGWGLYRAGDELRSLYMRGQSLNPITNHEAREQILNAAAFSLTLGAKALSKLKTGAARLPAAIMEVGAAGANTGALINSGADAIENWHNMSDGERALAVLEFGFFGKMTASQAAGGYNALRSELATRRLAFEQGMNERLAGKFGANATGVENRRIFENGRILGTASEFGLPSETPLVANPGIEGNGMRVAYDLNDAGRPVNLRIEFNPEVKPEWRDLALHESVARQIGRTGSLRERMGQWFRGEDAIQPGSLGWEARYDVDKLGAKATQLTRDLNAGGLTPERRAEIEGQLGDLRGEISQYEGLANKADALGRGFVAQPSKATLLAEARGLPTGDELPPYHIWSTYIGPHPKTGNVEPILYLRRTDASKIDQHVYDPVKDTIERVPNTWVDPATGRVGFGTPPHTDATYGFFKPGIKRSDSGGVLQFSDDKGRLLAEIRGGSLVYKYGGYGGDIVTVPDRATTVLGRYHEDGSAAGMGVRQFLGDGKPPPVESFPEGTITRGVGGVPPKGGLHFLDLPEAEYEANKLKHIAKQRADPKNDGKTDKEIEDLGTDAWNNEFWENHNLPHLKEAFERGDNIRLISHPIAHKKGTYEKELDAINGVGSKPGLAEEYGYVYDDATKTYVKQ